MGMLSNADIRAERRRMEAREDANDEGPTTFSAAEQLALILDRYEGDWGDDAEALAAIRDRIHDIITDVRVLLGEPAKAVFRDGRIVCLVREAL